MWLRVARVLMAGAVVAILGVVLGWQFAVPNVRPPLRAGESYGVDVSHHQGEIDWSAVAADGIEFAWIKASEGGDHADTRFEQNWTGAADAGLQRGAYHYFTLCRPGDEQARWFLEVAPPDDAALPPAVDLEYGGNCSARPTTAEINAEVDVFLRIVEEAWGREALVYVLDEWEVDHEVRMTWDRPQWVRRLGWLRPRLDDWAVWQLHGFATIDGIEGPTDINLGRLEMID